MEKYLLRKDVHFCCRGDAFVFLDLLHDDYLLLNGVDAASFRQIVNEPAVRPTSQALTNGPAGMLDQGLLTTDASCGKEIAVTRVVIAVDELLDPDRSERPALSMQHLWRFLYACTRASLQLRFVQLIRVVRSIEKRKKRRSNGSPVDLAQVRTLCALFDRFRMIFPTNYLCLYDSLALIEFLAQYRIFPTWVFGVTLEPWGAHCWVQHDGYLLNESAEVASKYSPVMAV